MSDNSLKKGRYTRHSNKIGLYSTSQDRIGFLSNNNDVVLSFPFKDAVLEAGMSKEDSGREERFLHQEIDGKDIDTLFEPKALTNFEYFSKVGDTVQKKTPTKSEIEFFDENGELQENLLIKGNNLLALHSLSSKLAGKVKLIYIDPPYNTGNDGFKYNDSFSHSSWLTFMKNRIEVAKNLLKDDGVIFVQCDDNEQAYLKVLMDEVFGREQFLNVITIKTKIGGVSGSSEGKSLRDATEFINMFCKNKALVELNPIYTKTEVNKYIESYRNEGKSWKYTQVLTSLGEKVLLEEKDGYSYYHYPNAQLTSVSRFSSENSIPFESVYTEHAQKVFRTTNAQSSVRTRVMDELSHITNGIVSVEYVPQKGKNKNQLTEVFYNGSNKDMFMFLSDVLSLEKNTYYYLQKITTLWDDIQYNNLNKEGGYVEFTNGKKPEMIIKKVIELATNPNDIVLDYHLGSGTTCAVAHKMGRRWIGIEQMDYIEDITKVRLTNVLEGEQGGISSSVDWKGGGSFVYFELKKYNQDFLNQIMAANSKGELDEVYADMAKNAFLKFWFDKNEFEKDENFRSLDLDQRKELLISILDENQLYLNHADMRDSRYHVSEEEMNLTDLFYGAKND